MARIYLDNNATTPLDPEVREAMQPYLGERFGNPSSNHREGEAARHGIEQARGQVAGLFKAPAVRLFFTSGGTESNNLAIFSASGADPDKKHILASLVEHDSVRAPLRYLRDRFGYEIEWLAVDNSGGLDLDRLQKAIRPDTVLVSLMAANNETGVVWPMAEIGAICRRQGVLLHCDAVQLAGKAPLDVEAMGIDYLALAGHKLHGPKGSGALYARRGAPLSPLIHGAGQEGGMRSGTENVPGIVGFGAACELAARHLGAMKQCILEMRQRLEEGIRAAIPDSLINGAGQPRLYNTVNVSFAGCASGALIQELDERGIEVSAHSACHGGDLNPSHVLSAMGVPEIFLHGTLRLSLSRFNTMAEVETLLKILPQIVEKSRRQAAG